jgi:hypothetical protein
MRLEMNLRQIREKLSALLGGQIESTQSFQTGT